MGNGVPLGQTEYANESSGWWPRVKQGTVSSFSNQLLLSPRWVGGGGGEGLCNNGLSDMGCTLGQNVSSRSSLFPPGVLLKPGKAVL